MCIAVLNRGAKLSPKIMKQMWMSNPQGAGLVYLDNQTKKLVVFKTKYESEIYAKYDVAKKHAKDGVVVLHFRIATQGFSDTNLHPFINKQRNLAFVHNGILQKYCVRGHSKSDTALFHEDVVESLNASFVYDDDKCDRMEKYIGFYNKMIFMNSIGHCVIINEKAGIWVGDDWFSNDSYRDYKHYYGSTQLDQTLINF